MNTTTTPKPFDFRDQTIISPRYDGDGMAFALGRRVYHATLQHGDTLYIPAEWPGAPGEGIEFGGESYDAPEVAPSDSPPTMVVLRSLSSGLHVWGLVVDRWGHRHEPEWISLGLQAIVPARWDHPRVYDQDSRGPSIDRLREVLGDPAAKGTAAEIERYFHLREKQEWQAHRNAPE